MDEVLSSEERFAPLRSLDIANPADGCVVLVLASETAATKLHANPVWIRGVGWASDSPSLETREWAGGGYARLAAASASRHAKLPRSSSEIDRAEVDARLCFKGLAHLDATG